MKVYQGLFLFKVNAIDDKPQNDTLLIPFIDETGQFANNIFELYKLTYRKSKTSISAQQIDRIKKTYVGKKFTLMAYETGKFTGLPQDYLKYRPTRTDTNFHFQNYLVVISVFTSGL